MLSLSDLDCKYTNFPSCSTILSILKSLNYPVATRSYCTLLSNLQIIVLLICGHLTSCSMMGAICSFSSWCKHRSDFRHQESKKAINKIWPQHCTDHQSMYRGIYIFGSCVHSAHLDSRSSSNTIPILARVPCSCAKLAPWTTWTTTSSASSSSDSDSHPSLSSPPSHASDGATPSPMQASSAATYLSKVQPSWPLLWRWVSWAICHHVAVVDWYMELLYVLSSLWIKRDPSVRSCTAVAGPQLWQALPDS